MVVIFCYAPTSARGSRQTEDEGNDPAWAAGISLIDPFPSSPYPHFPRCWSLSPLHGKGPVSLPYAKSKAVQEVQHGGQLTIQQGPHLVAGMRYGPKLQPVRGKTFDQATDLR